MENRNVLAAVIATLAMTATSAGAATDDSGFYAGAGYVRSTFDISDLDASKDANGWKLFGGYRINRNIALEAAYIDAGEISVNDGNFRAKASADAWQASVLGLLPLGEYWTLHARAGLLGWQVKVSATDGIDRFTEKEDGSDFIYGVGASMSFSSGYLRLEYEASKLEMFDARLISLSVAWPF